MNTIIGGFLMVLGFFLIVGIGGGVENLPPDFTLTDLGEIGGYFLLGVICFILGVVLIGSSD